jgi:uncharacterized protein YggE
MVRPVRLPRLVPLALTVCCCQLVSSAAGAQGLERCDGAILEAQGAAEVMRSAGRLAVSMGLEAEASTADGALALLQQRLATVRSALQSLAIKELQVTSPSTWNRPAGRGRPKSAQASLRLSGNLDPARFQALIRQVGALPGVRLSPVAPQPDPANDASVRRQLLEAAYRDALDQARMLGAAMGRSRLVPQEVRIEGRSHRPIPMRVMADAAAAPFDPAELPAPRQSLSLVARFCAEP